MKNTLSRSFSAFVSLFFPKLCPACHSPLSVHEKVICWYCQMSLPQTFHYNDPLNSLWQKMNEFLQVENAVALFDFQKNSRIASLLHALKYRGNQQIGAFLANWLAPLLIQSEVFREVDAILPLPLHPTRHKSRGYNQVQLFSERLAHHLEIPVIHDLVFRKKKTRQLAMMKQMDRWKEVEEAFGVNKDRHYVPQHWLLVDDVITTGATISSCGKVILEGCGGRISIVSLASRLS